MIPTEFWKSEASGANYPIGWRIELPGSAMQIMVRPALRNQELALTPLAYWEGAVEVKGTRVGRPVTCRVYLELTGYAVPLLELQR